MTGEKCVPCAADDHGACPLTIRIEERITPDGVHHSGTFLCGCECRSYVNGPRWTAESWTSYA